MNISKMINEIDKELNEKYKINNSYNFLIGHIKLEDLFTTTNIYISAMRCAAGFRSRNDTQKFLRAPWLNSYKLCSRVLNGTFKPGYYRVKRIMERGKVREIKPPVFESKIIQKLLCDWIVRPLLEPEMIHTSYASVAGKGTDKMYKDVLRAINSEVKNRNEYIVMTDFKGYFSSIDIHILRKILSQRIKDERIVNLIMEFSPDEKGLSLGNELSQIPASFYPTSIDKAVKNNISTGHYFRYMDDTLFIAKDMEEVEIALRLFKEETDKLKLVLKDPKIVPINKSFVFCKERFLFDKKRNKYFRLCNKEIFIREKRKLKLFKSKLECKDMNIEDINMQYICVKNSILHRPNSKKSLINLEKYYEKLFK